MMRASESKLEEAARLALDFIPRVSVTKFRDCDLLCGSSEPLRIARKLRAALRQAERSKAGVAR